MSSPKSDHPDVEEQGCMIPDRLSSREALIRDLLSEMAELRHERAKSDRLNQVLQRRVEQLQQRLSELENGPDTAMAEDMTVWGSDWDDEGTSVDGDYETDSDSDDATESDLASEPEHSVYFQSETDVGSSRRHEQLVFDLTAPSDFIDPIGNESAVPVEGAQIKIEDS